MVSYLRRLSSQEEGVSDWMGTDEDVHDGAARGRGEGGCNNDAQDDDGGSGGAREEEGGAVMGSGLMVSYMRMLSLQEKGVSDWTVTDKDNDGEEDDLQDRGPAILWQVCSQDGENGQRKRQQIAILPPSLLLQQGPGGREWQRCGRGRCRQQRR